MSAEIRRKLKSMKKMAINFQEHLPDKSDFSLEQWNNVFK